MDVPHPHNLFDFSGQVVVVTGSGSGLGSGIALRFAEAGAKVVVNYRSSAEGAQAVVAEIESLGGSAEALQADVSQKTDVTRLVEKTVEHFGQLNILINNAGLYPLNSLIDMKEEEWDLVLDSNLRSTFLCTQAAARQMIDQGSGGAIVNIASIEGQNPAPKHSHYDAAKGGVLMQHGRQRLRAWPAWHPGERRLSRPHLARGLGRRVARRRDSLAEGGPPSPGSACPATWLTPASSWLPRPPAGSPEPIWSWTAV